MIGVVERTADNMGLKVRRSTNVNKAPNDDRAS